MSLRLQINGETATVDASLHDTLLTVLRDQLQLVAAKRGCNQGVCGACTVHVDGWPARACLSLAHGCEGAQVRTLEGLAETPRLCALQRAFVDAGAFQCGFCTPGMLMSACALLRHEPNPSEAQIVDALEGNLCRCTGYVNIVASVQQAAQTLAAKGERA